MNTTTTEQKPVSNFRTELVASAKGALIERLRNVRTKEEVRELMRVMSRFHRYSLNNQILIAFQFPAATHVAGFGTWKKFRRDIKAGSKAIKILAPCEYSVLDEDTNEEIVRLGFRVVNVFDVSQTSGKDLPNIDDDIKGSDMAGLYARAKHYTSIRNIDLHYTAKGRAAGWIGLDGITIKESNTKNKELAALLHELSHFELGHLSCDKSRQLQELEAESCAFVIAHKFGFDTKSEKYLMSWSKFDDDAVMAALDNVHGAAQKIINGLTGIKPALAQGRN